MAKINKLPELKYLAECFYFDVEGDLYWRERPAEHFRRHKDHLTFKGKLANRKVGSPKGNGYLVVRLLGTSYHLHRIVFALFHMRDPYPMVVDHIDGNKANNYFTNLRTLTYADNARHRLGIGKKNASGVRGVYWNKQVKKWWVEIKVNKVKIYIGIFKDILEAKAAREQAELKYCPPKR